MKKLDKYIEMTESKQKSRPNPVRFRKRYLLRASDSKEAKSSPMMNGEIAGDVVLIPPDLEAPQPTSQSSLLVAGSVRLSDFP
jgi:hypothetical protein